MIWEVSEEVVSLIISKYFSFEYLLILKAISSLAQDIKKIVFEEPIFRCFVV